LFAVALLAAILNVDHLVRASGYPLLFVLVMAETSGIPIPGETALIAAAVLASQETLAIEIVIPLAAAAAIVGDNIGYVIGRKGGRWLLTRPGRFQGQRMQVLTTGEPFFERHGPKAVFFGRFILGLRVWASWLAGATHMPWRSFVVWNALGGITWAVVIGMTAYLLGNSASGALEAFGVYGLVAIVLGAGGFLYWHRRQRYQARLAAGRDSAGRDAARPEGPDGGAASAGRHAEPTPGPRREGTAGG
jgi:membrane protein DedA with SNARE-associated domain